MQFSETRLSNSDLRIFITGATGLVGLQLVRHLGDLGCQIVAMVRRTSDTRLLNEYAQQSGAQVEIVVADLLDQIKIEQFMRGCDVVVHTAAVIDPHGNSESLRLVNIDGTKSVLQSAINSQIKQFIHISSLSVIMGDHDCFGVTEEEPLHYCREGYANSKIDAERLVMSAETTAQINVTALRPGFIYGPNEKTWLPKMIKNLKARTAMLVGDGSKETNLIYVGNLCRAIELSILNPVAYGQIYNLTDGELVTKKRLFEVVCAGLSLPMVRISIPLPLARSLVELCAALAKIAPPRLKARLAMFSRPALRLIGLNQGFDISKAERELGYTQRIPFAEGMARTLVSYVAGEQNCGANASVQNRLTPSIERLQGTAVRL